MPALLEGARAKGGRVITAKTIDEFCERCKTLLDDPGACKCPECGAGQLFASYGVAGGGIGPYVLCLACGEIVLKAIEEGGEGEVFNA